MPSILIIDDSAAIRRALRFLFQSMGWRVRGEAVDGRYGIEQAERLKPDIAVLDMSMPRLDGFAVAKVLHAEMPSLPVILFTNFEEGDLRRHAVDSGIRQVVSKTLSWVGSGD